MSHRRSMPTCIQRPTIGLEPPMPPCYPAAPPGPDPAAVWPPGTRLAALGQSAIGNWCTVRWRGRVDLAHKIGHAGPSSVADRTLTVLPTWDPQLAGPWQASASLSCCWIKRHTRAMHHMLPCCPSFQTIQDAHPLEEPLRNIPLHRRGQQHLRPGQQAVWCSEHGMRCQVGRPLQCSNHGRCTAD